MSQPSQQTKWNLPPRIEATASSLRRRGLIASSVAALGLLISVVSLILPQLTAPDSYTGGLRDGAPIVAVIAVGLASIGGLAGIAKAQRGRPGFMTAAIFGGAVNCVAAILIYSEVTRLSRETVGAIQTGVGLYLLIAGATLAGVAGLIAVDSMAFAYEDRLD